MRLPRRPFALRTAATVVPYRSEIVERFSPRLTTWVTGSLLGAAVRDAGAAPASARIESCWPARMTLPRRPLALCTAATLVPYRFEMDERFSPWRTTCVTSLPSGTVEDASVTTMDSRCPDRMRLPRMSLDARTAATVVPYRSEIDERLSPRRTMCVTRSLLVSVAARPSDSWRGA